MRGRVTRSATPSPLVRQRQSTSQGRWYEPYLGEEWVAAAETILRACRPSVALFPHTLKAREVVSRVAARLGTAAITDCVRLRVEKTDVVMTKPVYGGSVLADYVVGSPPR